MSGFFHFLFRIIFIAILLTVFIFTVIYLKPFRIHRKRKISTITLKISYLFFLMVFLTCFYFFLLFGNTENEDELHSINYSLIIISLLIPKIGIFFRRKVKKGRILYNYLFTTLNLTFIIYLVYFLFQSPGIIKK